MNTHFILKHYSELTKDELYHFLQLRQRVFVVEQQCPFLDCDDLDQLSWHLMCRTEEGVLASYCRLLPVGVSYDNYSSIGRVVSEPTLRRGGYGRMIMEEGINKCRELFGNIPIKIGAQLYLKKFYESFGFEAVGEVYLEDDIDHIKMVLPDQISSTKPS